MNRLIAAVMAATAFSHERQTPVNNDGLVVCNVVPAPQKPRTRWRTEEETIKRAEAKRARKGGAR